MRAYVASKYQNKDEVRRAQKMLREKGVEITYDWTLASDEGKTGKELETFLAEQARLDKYGVESADYVLFIGHPGMRGGFVEFGIALAREKRILVVNREHVEQIFTRLRSRAGGVTLYFDTVEAAVAYAA